MNDATPAMPASALAGALAHLARHMQTGCPRAASLAALLLEQIAADLSVDVDLRAHAERLADLLERGGKFCQYPGRSCLASAGPA